MWREKKAHESDRIESNGIKLMRSESLTTEVDDVSMPATPGAGGGGGAGGLFL